jgi:hypothetical protein
MAGRLQFVRSTLVPVDRIDQCIVLDTHILSGVICDEMKMKKSISIYQVDICAASGEIGRAHV